MPVRNLAQYLEETCGTTVDPEGEFATAFLDGAQAEADAVPDPEALADDAEGTCPFEGELEELNPDFERKVRVALEYAMHHQRLNEAECARRRTGVNGWLDEMRRPGYYREWADNANRIASRCLEQAPTVPTTPLSPEEQAEYEEKRARWWNTIEQRNAEEKKRKDAANERAERLLRSALSMKQIAELDRRGYFHVESRKRRFRITRGRSANVLEVDARGRILRRFCAHPTEPVPDADTMLAQKFMIESKPKVFFKIANVTRHRRARRLDERLVQIAAAAAARREEVGARRGIQVTTPDLHSLIERAQHEALDATALHDTPDGRAA